MNCSTFTESAKSFGSLFNGFLGSARQHISQVGGGLRAQERFNTMFRGIALDSGRAMFRDSGQFLRENYAMYQDGTLNAREALSTTRQQAARYARSGYLRNAGVGLSAGAAVGALNAYRNEDGPGGYAANMAGGMLLGGAGAHLTSMAMTRGTALHSAFSRMPKLF